MSTAGKILAGIVILASLAWIALFAKITDWNKSWGQHYQKLEEERKAVEKQIPEVEAQLDEKLAEVTREQTHLNHALTVFRARLSDLQKLDTESREALDRIKFQLASVEASVKSAQMSDEFRAQEKAQTEKDLATERARVEGLKVSVGKQMDELANMRGEFIRLLAENKEMLQKIQQRLRGGGGVRVRSATLKR